MSRRSALIGFGAASLALFVFLALVDPSRVADGNPNIVDFEFAGSEDEAATILADWGEEGKDAARLSLWADFAYMITYGALFALAASAIRDVAATRGWRRLAAVGGFAVIAAIAAASFDAIENVWLLITLGGHGGDLAPRLGAIFASLKFAMTIVTLVYIGAGLLTMARHRGKQSPV